VKRYGLIFSALLASLAAPLAGQGGRGAPPPTGRPGAVFNITGYWVSQINEDWRWRIITPPKGDFASVPLNTEGRPTGELWDPAKDKAEGNECKAYGAAGLMGLPTRVHITWADDMTLKLETDAGQQTRLFHFGPWKPAGDPTWQGDSVASWSKQAQSREFAPPFGGPAPGSGGALQVVTTHMKAGYLRKNGVPYSANAVFTEYYDRVEADGVSYLILTSVVDDLKYLNDTFITSEQFKAEPDAAKWHPSPCKL
jgi:hypothetical protein